jgi:hypothetical protein
MSPQTEFFAEQEIKESYIPAFVAKDWEKKGHALMKDHDRRQWELGEWLDQGVDALTKSTALKKAMKITGYAQTTLWDFVRTVKAFPDENSRRRELSWSHHKEVAIAKLSEEDRCDLLDRATTDDHIWSIQELRTQVRNLKRRGPSDHPELFKFQVSVRKATFEFLTLRAAESNGLKLAQVAGAILDDRAKQGES